VLHRAELRRVDRPAIGACVIGLAMVAASADADQPPPAPPSTYVTLFVGTALLALTMVAVWRGPRAWPLAMVAGLGLGGTSLAVRAVRVPTAMDAGLFDLLLQPAAYLMVLLWIIGMLGYTRALRIGTVTRVTAVFQVTEVVVPGLVAIALLNDRVRPGWELPMAVGLVLAAGGVLALARSSPASRPPESEPAEMR
jgi:drug/metabolite transporter (DMT)-like permease